jgi:hypothetical protein
LLCFRISGPLCFRISGPGLFFWTNLELSLSVPQGVFKPSELPWRFAVCPVYFSYFDQNVLCYMGHGTLVGLVLGLIDVCLELCLLLLA